MEKTELKRQSILNDVADYLLTHGLQESSLRQIATKIGTSDRMLLHYFVDKQELMNAALHLIAQRMMELLNTNQAGQMPYEALLRYLAGMIQQPEIRNYLRIWLELIAMSASQESYRLIAQQIAEQFYEWIAALLQVDQESERAPTAALAFATIEGFVLLDALGSGKKIGLALESLKTSQTSPNDL